MDDFKHKELLEKKLRKELILTKSKAKFVKKLVTGDEGRYSSAFIAEKFIQKYGNKHKIHKPDSSRSYFTIFDDIVIFGKILEEKAMEILEENWDYCVDDEDHTNDACVQDPMRFNPGDWYSQMGC